MRAEAARALRPGLQSVTASLQSHALSRSTGGDIDFTSEWSHISNGCVCPGMQGIGVIEKLPYWSSQKEFRSVTNFSFLSASVSLGVQGGHWVWLVSGPVCVQGETQVH